MVMRKLVGQNVARFRKQQNLTQEQLEERSGLSQQYISELERGQRNPTVITLYQITQALELEPAELLEQWGSPQ